MITPEISNNFSMIVLLLAFLGCFIRWWPLRAITWVVMSLTAIATMMNITSGFATHHSTVLFGSIFVGLLICRLIPTFIAGWMEGSTRQQEMKNAYLDAQKEYAGWEEQQVQYQEPSTDSMNAIFLRGQAPTAAEFQQQRLPPLPPLPPHYRR